jgi:hypothetical protein
MKNNKSEVTSAQVAEPSKSKKGATPAKSTQKVKAESTEKAKAKKPIVKAKNEEAIAEKVRETLYIYPASVMEPKIEGERQRRKKAFRQDMRKNLKNLVKALRNVKKAEPLDLKEVKVAKKNLQNFCNEHLTSSGLEKFSKHLKFEKLLA